MVRGGALGPVPTLTPESRPCVSDDIMAMADFLPLNCDRYDGSRVMGDVEVDTWCLGVDLADVLVEEE